MNKFVKIIILSVTFFVIAVILSVIFKFSLSNTWQGGVAVLFIFGPFWVYTWGLSTRLKHLPFVCNIIRFFLITAVVAYVLVTYVLIRDGVIQIYSGTCDKGTVLLSHSFLTY